MNLSTAGLLVWLRCKTHAGPGRAQVCRPGPLPARWPGPGCANTDRTCSLWVQGKHLIWSGLRAWLPPLCDQGLLASRAGTRLLAGLLLCIGPLALTAPLAATCSDTGLVLQALGPQRWWLPAQPGEADAANRGQVANLLLTRQGRRLWLLGSGPSPAFGRLLACQLKAQLGLVVTDVVSPWARPELVLGVAGLGPVRHWAHAQVAQAMTSQCPTCVDRLRQSLGAAADDLGDDPIRLPDRLLRGSQGRLGPLRWWRLPRAANSVVTVWRVPAASGPVWLAPGLVQGAGPPDGRDADIHTLALANGRLAARVAADGSTARFLGEQGGLLPATTATLQQRYWQALLAQVRSAIENGDQDSAPAQRWPGLAEAWASHPLHDLNWQRAWRQIEPLVLGGPGAAPASWPGR